MNERYARQIALPGFGSTAQAALLKAKVLVIGAGGLGCPALLYVASAGVGTIGIIDHDHIELSNLHRQILYNEGDIGKNKAAAAAEKLRNINSKLDIQVYENKIHTGNALDIISGYDVVIDGSDNFPTRYLVNDACALLGVPLVYGSVFRYHGQVSVFHAAPETRNIMHRAANYRDIFPVPPAEGDVPNCIESGVLGVLTGIIGTLQATEAIKLLTGIGDVLSFKILTYDLLSHSMEQYEFSERKNALDAAPRTKREFSEMRYDIFCGNAKDVREITWETLAELDTQESLLLIDVREADELPKIQDYTAISIPMNQLYSALVNFDTSKTIVLFCQTGGRSLHAAQVISTLYHQREVWSIRGGVNAFPWKQST